MFMSHFILCLMYQYDIYCPCICLLGVCKANRQFFSKAPPKPSITVQPSEKLSRQTKRNDAIPVKNRYQTAGLSPLPLAVKNLLNFVAFCGFSATSCPARPITLNGGTARPPVFSKIWNEKHKLKSREKSWIRVKIPRRGIIWPKLAIIVKMSRLIRLYMTAQLFPL